MKYLKAVLIAVFSIMNVSLKELADLNLFVSKETSFELYS